ncbi:MAG: 6-bladed beta-propeller [Candidatus Muiribacteriaceae bacterium]
MKKYSKYIVTILLLCFGFFMVSCGEEEKPETEKVGVYKPNQNKDQNVLPVFPDESSDRYLGMKIIAEIPVESMKVDEEMLNIPFDSSDNFYIPDNIDGTVRKYSSNGMLIKTYSPGMKNIAAIHSYNNDLLLLDTERQIIYRTDTELKIKGRALEGKPVVERGGSYRIAVDKAGLYYIMNFDDGIIEVFKSDFKKIREFRTDISTEIDIAFDNRGHRFFIADSMNSKISGFDIRSGEVIFSLGRPGQASSEFSANIFACYFDDKIYIADSGNARVQVFNASDGAYIKSFGKKGAGDGQFVEPVDIYADPSGLVFVLDRKAHKVQVFDADGGFVRSISEYGRTEGALYEPEKIFGIPGLGFVFITDMQNERIQCFNLNGEFIKGYSVLSDEMSDSFGIIADRQDNVFIVSAEGERVIRYSVDDMVSSVPDKASTASNIAVDNKGAVIFVNRKKQRLQYNEPGGRSMNINYSISAHKNPDIKVRFDYFDIDSDGNIFVLDRYNHRIVKYSSDGKMLNTLGTGSDKDGDYRMDYGFGYGEFRNPYFMAIDPSDNLFVADRGNHRVQKFTNTGDFIKAFGRNGIGEGTFIGKFSFVITGDGYFVVTDYARSYLQIYDITGNFISRFGKFGDKRSQFINPLACGVDSENNVYVMNSKSLEPFAKRDTLYIKKMKVVDLWTEAINYYRKGLFSDALRVFTDISRFRQDEKTLFYGWYCANKKDDLENKEYFDKLLKDNKKKLSEKTIKLLRGEGLDI